MNVQYTVTVELGNLESQSFESLESRIREGVFQAGRELMLQLWNLWEENFQLRNPEAKSAGRREAGFKTLVGELRYERRRVIQGGRLRIPLDEWTQVSARERATPAFLARMESHIVNHPYRQATALLEAETGVRQTAMSSWRPGSSWSGWWRWRCAASFAEGSGALAPCFPRGGSVASSPPTANVRRWPVGLSPPDLFAPDFSSEQRADGSAWLPTRP
jgi:hypothetical protein